MFIEPIIRQFMIAYSTAGEGDGGGGSGDDGDGGDGEGDGQGDGSGDGDGDKSGVGSGMFDRAKSGDDGDGDGSGDGDGDGDGDKGGKDDGRPKGLADKYWDADKGEVRQDALIKSNNDLEKQLGKLKREKSIGGEVPEDADGYFDDDFALPDEVKNLTVEGPDDPGLKAWGEVCHKRGIGKELAIDLAKDMFTVMDGLVEPAIDPDAEFDKLGDQGPAIIEGIKTWAQSLEKSGRASEADVSVINQLSETADGVRFLSLMREQAGEARIPYIPAGGKKGMSQDQWHREYKQAVKDNDYTKQAELDGISAEIFGTAPSHGGRAGGVDHDKNLRPKK